MQGSLLWDIMLFDEMFMRKADEQQDIPTWAAWSSFLLYADTLDTVMSELEQALQTEIPHSAQHLAALALHPPRILRAVLEYKADGRLTAPAAELVTTGLDICSDVYQFTPDSLEIGAERLSALRNYLQHHEPRLLEWLVLQRQDDMTWLATHPNLAERSVHSLHHQTHGGDILLVPLAHGSLATGIDVFLRYSSMTGSDSCAIYPLKYSAHKHKDAQPHLLPEEADYLRGILPGKTLVVLDEDSFTGTTISAASEFLRQALSYEGRLIRRSNISYEQDILNSRFRRG